MGVGWRGVACGLLSHLSHLYLAIQSTVAQMACKLHSTGGYLGLKSGCLEGQVLGRAFFWVVFGCDLVLFPVD